MVESSTFTLQFTLLAVSPVSISYISLIEPCGIMAENELVIVEDKAAFDKLLKDNADKLVVVDFYADWCGPCKVIAPEFKKLAKEHPDVIFAKVNVDDNSETSDAEGISAMPTFRAYKGGKKVGEVVGASMPQVVAMVTKNM